MGAPMFPTYDLMDKAFVEVSQQGADDVEPMKYDGQAAANAHWKAKRIAAEVAADEEGMPTLPGDEGDFLPGDEGEEGMPTMPGDEGDFLPGDEGEEGMPTMPESRSEKIQI